MANPEHLAKLKEGVAAWNKWREANPSTIPDLRNANLENAQLDQVNLGEALLSGVNLEEASLYSAYLRKADLFTATLTGSDLRYANLSKADLTLASLVSVNARGAKFIDAILRETDLSEAKLNSADFTRAILIETRLFDAELEDCNVYGISAWDLELLGTKQTDLNISPDPDTQITVDNLEVAQFIYMMLNSQKIRDVLETITTKSVLILGRFSDAQLKARLDAMRDKLRELNYLPIVFDFERLTGQDFTETIKLLAAMSKFVIAELSQAQSIQQELQAIIPDFEKPVVPIIQKGEQVWSMFESHQRKDHVLPIVTYNDTDDLISKFNGIVINPAEKKHQEIVIKKAEYQNKVISSDDIPPDDV